MEQAELCYAPQFGAAKVGGTNANGKKEEKRRKFCITALIFEQRCEPFPVCRATGRRRTLSTYVKTKNTRCFFLVHYLKAVLVLQLAGMVAGNVVNGTMKLASWDQALANDGSLFVLDVRLPAEFAEQHIPGAHNIPLVMIPNFKYSSVSFSAPFKILAIFFFFFFYG